MTSLVQAAVYGVDDGPATITVITAAVLSVLAFVLAMPSHVAAAPRPRAIDDHNGQAATLATVHHVLTAPMLLSAALLVTMAVTEQAKRLRTKQRGISLHILRENERRHAAVSVWHREQQRKVVGVRVKKPSGTSFGYAFAKSGGKCSVLQSRQIRQHALVRGFGGGFECPRQVVHDGHVGQIVGQVEGRPRRRGGCRLPH